jgi:nitrogen fixation NifU-like protein
MLEELRELYQDVILDHGRSPRNFRRLEHATCDAVGHNPMCGDAIHVYLLIDGKGSIADVAFEGKGCAISMASASLMTEILRGKSVSEADRLFEVLHGLCTEEAFDPASAGNVDADALERLQVLAGVRGFPVRVKCATLAWHTMKAALAGEMRATTE